MDRRLATPQVTQSCNTSKRANWKVQHPGCQCIIQHVTGWVVECLVSGAEFQCAEFVEDLCCCSSPGRSEGAEVQCWDSPYGGDA